MTTTPSSLINIPIHNHATVSSLSPELLSPILILLTRHDLTRCVLVSRTWNILFSPFLWHTLRCQEPTLLLHRKASSLFHASKLFARFEASFMDAGALRRSGRWIREVKTPFLGVLGMLVANSGGGGEVTRVEKLAVGCFPDPDRALLLEAQEFPASATTRIVPIANTTAVSPQQGPSTNNSSKRALEPLILFLQQNQRLRTVTLQGSSLSSWQDTVAAAATISRNDQCAVLEALPSSVEHLVLYSWFKSGTRHNRQSSLSGLTPLASSIIVESDTSVKSSSPPPPPILSQLKKLTLRRCFLDDRAIFHLIERCPNLETFQIQGLAPVREHMDTYHLLATTLRTSCPRLTEFQLSDCHGTILLDVDMAALMDAGSLSGWKVLDLKAVLDQDPSQTQMDAPLGPLTIAAILRHAPTLEHIRLDNRPTFPSTAIQTLLCTAPNLRRFSTMSSLELKPHVAYLDARDIKSVDEEPWACLQLESFSCMIAHVPRQDLGYKQWERCGLNFAAEMEEDEVSRTVQRRICGQLGRLTRLRVLCLGHVAMPDPRVYFYENSSDYDEDGNYTNSRSYYNNAFAGDVYDDDDYDSSLSSDQEFDQQMTKDEQQYRSLFGNDTLQNSSLSLTLDKGLDLLADLTRLRYLDMRGMHVGIWEDEKLDWAKCFWRHRPIMRSALRGSVVKEPWKGIDPFWEEFGGWNQYE